MADPEISEGAVETTGVAAALTSPEISEGAVETTALPPISTSPEIPEAAIETTAQGPGVSTPYLVLGDMEVAPPGPPAAPIISLVSVGDESITISWPQVSGAASYNIYYDDDGVHPPWDPGTIANEGAPPINQLDGPSPSIQLTGLPNGVLHFLRVSAVSVSFLESPLSNEIQVSPVSPPVTAPTVIAVAGDEFIQLTWDVIPGATGYKVFYDDDPVNPPWDPTILANEGVPPILVVPTNLNLTGVPNGVLHFIQVLAFNGSGDGPLSLVVTATPLAAICPTFQVIRACTDLPITFEVSDSGRIPVPFITLDWTPVVLAHWEAAQIKSLSENDFGVPLAPGLSNANNCKSVAAPQTIGYRLYRDDAPCNPFVPTPSNLIADETVLTAEIGTFTDLTVIPGTDYVYFIEVVGAVF